MGQKVHPYGFRLGYNKNWQSRWFSKKDYPAFVYEDHEVRKYVKKLLYSAGISKIEIERAGGKIRLILSTARPGIVIGRKGVEIEKLRNDLRAKFGREFSLEVNEIRRPEVDSQLVAENIAQQLENRITYYEKGDRRKRAHHLITRGAAIESVAPLTKVLTETEFYTFAEKALAIPEVKGLLMEAVNEHNRAEQKERC